MWQLLINLIILSIVVPTLSFTSNESCPEKCYCRNFPCETLDSFCFKTTVQCKSWNASFGLPNTTDHLDVSRLDNNTLCNFLSNLSELQLLKSLVIRNSDVNNKCLQKLPINVTDLKLCQNNLTVLPEFVVNTINLKLRSLDFSQNQIKLVSGIKSFKTLQTLNISQNSISEIKPHSFKALESLKILDLSRNDLSTLNKELFQHLTALKLLNLSYNNIKTLQDSSFSDLQSLEQLDFSFNKLIKVNLESFDLPNLTTLYLTGNKQVGKLNNLLVGTSKKLKFVDASDTGEESIPGVLTQSVRTLKLAKNNIKSINSGELDAYPLLQLLDLSSNKINFVQEDSFGRLDDLTILYLQDNKLLEIPKTLPEQMIVLHLQSNNILKVSKNDLRGLFSLEVLNLRDNKITYIEEQTLSNLTSLAALDLSENPISILGFNSLYGPQSLQTLHLSAVGTISPAKDVSFPLLSPENLVLLDLSHSAGLARQMLNDEAFLDAAKQLQELDLSDNGLESIRSDLFHYLPQLRVLNIQNNRINCSGLEWLASWMRRQDHSHYSSIICANPTYLRGLPLVDLQYVETPSIRPINQTAVSINQVRKSGTTTYQVGQYDRGQKTSFKITMDGKNDDNERIIDRSNKITNTQRKIENIIEGSRVPQKIKKLTIGDNSTQVLNTLPSTQFDQSLVTKSSSLKRINNDQLSLDPRNNKTHLNSDIVVERNNILNVQHTQNARLYQTSSRNNTNTDVWSQNKTKFDFSAAKLTSKISILQALSVKPTSNMNKPANVPSRSRNQSQNRYINNTKPLSGETRGGNNLNQDKEGNTVTRETLIGTDNLISTYQDKKKKHEPQTILQQNKTKELLTLTSIKSFTPLPPKSNLDPKNPIKTVFKPDLETRQQLVERIHTKSDTFNLSKPLLDLEPDKNLSDQPELSMYKKENPSPTFVHSGIIILTAGVFSGVITLIFLATKINRERRTANNALCRESNENIEVSTLPNVTELW